MIDFDSALTSPAMILLFGYLLGSVPFGLILTRFFGQADLRQIGSGNIGATNVLRTGRKDLAFLTLVCDGGKGAVATLLAGSFGDTPAAGALGAMIGHLFPVWLGFKGGKGVATAFGSILALHWGVGLALCAIWLLSAVIFRISSLSALIAMATLPVLIWFQDGALMEAAVAMSVLIWIRHRSNIILLLKGQESKIGQGKG